MSALIRRGGGRGVLTLAEARSSGVKSWNGQTLNIDWGSLILVHEGEPVGEMAILGFPSQDIKCCVGMLEAVADELLI